MSAFISQNRSITRPLRQLISLRYDRRLHACRLLIPLLLIAVNAHATEAKDKLNLWYDREAKDWLSALPIGNGNLGGMIYGGVAEEHISFNVSSLWTGNEIDMGNYQPFGDVYFRQSINVDSANAYRRALSLDNAIHTVTYQIGSTTQQRLAFASYPDQVMVMHFRNSGPDLIHGQLRITDAHQAQISAEGTRVTSTGTLSNGMTYHAQVRVVLDQGKCHIDNQQLVVENARSVTLYLAADTSFVNDPRKDWRGNNAIESVNQRLDLACRKGLEELKRRHIADYQSLFHRLSLDLGTSKDELPTDQRLNQYAQEKSAVIDPSFDALVYQYGRYLLISSSRPGGLPANLQGIWNRDMKPAWYSGYTTNINVEMNYWLAEPTGLSECHRPLLDWIENLAYVRKKGAQPALKTDRGWIIYSTNNPMGGNSTWGLHRPGSAWLSQHLWTHYAYQPNESFLRNKAYPLLKELTEYWQHFLVKDATSGKWITPAGWSPEHGPKFKEGDRTTYPGVSYDQQIVWDLFTNYIEAARVLGVDADYREQIQTIRDNMLAPQIGRWGQLQEWMEDWDEPKDQHRHVSHLFAVHPGRQINPLTTPDWAKAAAVSLNARGDGGTGWSKAWKINFWARLADGNRAHRLIRSLLQPVKGNSGGFYPNLFDAHPPFQIDGNLGATAGMTEMLLQSHVCDDTGTYHINLLPALPDAWPRGEVRGLRARGGFIVNIAWDHGTLKSASIQSSAGAPCVVHIGNRETKLHLKTGETHSW